MITIPTGGWIYCSPAPHLGSGSSLGNGRFVFSLDNGDGAPFSVLATTNAALLLSSWEILGQATPALQFTDSNATKYPQRFYRLRWP